MTATDPKRTLALNGTATMRTAKFFILFTLLGCGSCASNAPHASDKNGPDRQIDEELRQYFEESREAYFASADSPATSKEDRVRIRLDETLYKFAEAQSVTGYELQPLLGDKAIDGEYWPKGGVGILRGSLYVVLSGQKNVVLLGEGREWEGKSSGESEIVLVSKSREIVDESSFSYDDGVIIFFTLDEVRFIDFSRNSGGRYSRSRDPDDPE